MKRGRAAGCCPRGLVRWLNAVAVALVLLSVARAARAQGSECRSVRVASPAAELPPPAPVEDAAQLLVAPTDKQWLPGILIWQGETLCLEARSRANELEVRIVAESKHALRLSLGMAGERSVLKLENPGPAPLYYQTSLDAEGAQPLGPESSAQLSAAGRRESVLVAGFRTRPREPRMLSPELAMRAPRPRFPARRLWLGISAIASLHYNRLPLLERAFHDRGYSSADTVQPIIGYAFDLGGNHWRASSDLGCWGKRDYFRLRDHAHFGIQQCFVAVYAGTDIVRQRGFSVFPLVGMGGGDLRVQYDPDDPPLLADQLASHPDVHEVRRNLWLAAAALGFEQTFHLTSEAYLLLGTRIGYAWQLAQNRWVGDQPKGPTFDGGPTIDTTGPFIRFGLGLVVQTGASP